MKLAKTFIQAFKIASVAILVLFLIVMPAIAVMAQAPKPPASGNWKDVTPPDKPARFALSVPEVEQLTIAYERLQKAQKGQADARQLIEALTNAANKDLEAAKLAVQVTLLRIGTAHDVKDIDQYAPRDGSAPGTVEMVKAEPPPIPINDGGAKMGKDAQPPPPSDPGIAAAKKQ